MNKKDVIEYIEVKKELDAHMVALMKLGEKLYSAEVNIEFKMLLGKLMADHYQYFLTPHVFSEFPELDTALSDD